MTTRREKESLQTQLTMLQTTATSNTTDDYLNASYSSITRSFAQSRQSIPEELGDDEDEEEEEEDGDDEATVNTSIQSGDTEDNRIGVEDNESIEEEEDDGVEEIPF